MFRSRLAWILLLGGLLLIGFRLSTGEHDARALDTNSETGIPQPQRSLRVGPEPFLTDPSTARADSDRTCVDGPENAGDRVVNVDGQLLARDPESGDFVPEWALFELVESDTILAQTVFVHEGRWSAEVRAGPRYSIRALKVGVQEADALPESLTFPGEGEDCVLRASLRSRGELRVVDAETGREARNITVVIATSLSHSDRPYPPLDLLAAPALRNAASPVPMPDVSGVNSYWLKTTDSAWEHVSFSGEGGTRTLELQAGGALAVDVAGSLAGRTCRFRLHSSARDGALLDEEIRSPGSLDYSGLLPGSYVGQLVTVPRSGPATVLAEEALEIRPRATLRIGLTIDSGALESTGSLAGSVLLPEPGTARSWLVFRRASDPSEEAFRVVLGRGKETSGALRWRALDVPAGDYRVQLEPIGVEFAITCMAGDVRTRDLDLQELARVFVNPLDTLSGVTLPDSLAWRRVASDGTAEWSRVGRAPVAGRFEFLVHPGAVELQLDGIGFTSGLQRFDVFAGPNDLVLPFQSYSPCSLEVASRCQTLEAPLPGSFWNGIQCSGEDGSTRGLAGRRAPAAAEAPATTQATANATLLFERPGRYRLDFPVVPGFEPIAPRTVEVSLEAAARLDIELVGPPAAAALTPPAVSSAGSR